MYQVRISLSSFALKLIVIIFGLSTVACFESGGTFQVPCKGATCNSDENDSLFPEGGVPNFEPIPKPEEPTGPTDPTEPTEPTDPTDPEPEPEPEPEPTTPPPAPRIGRQGLDFPQSVVCSFDIAGGERRHFLVKREDMQAHNADVYRTYRPQIKSWCKRKFQSALNRYCRVKSRKATFSVRLRERWNNSSKEHHDIYGADGDQVSCASNPTRGTGKHKSHCSVLLGGPNAGATAQVIHQNLTIGQCYDKALNEKVPAFCGFFGLQRYDSLFRFVKNYDNGWTEQVVRAQFSNIRCDKR